MNITSSFQSVYVHFRFTFFSSINSLNLYMNIVLHIKEVRARCAIHVCTHTHRQIRGKMWTKIQLGNDEDRGREKENCHTNQHEMCSQEMPKSSTISFCRNSTFWSTLCAVHSHSHTLHFSPGFYFFGLPFARTIYSVRFFRWRLLHMGMKSRRRRRTRARKHKREEERKK